MQSTLNANQVKAVSQVIGKTTTCDCGLRPGTYRHPLTGAPACWPCVCEVADELEEMARDNAETRRRPAHLQAPRATSGDEYMEVSE